MPTWLVDVRPGEVPRLWRSFGAFFLLLAGYYLLRPVRDAMGIAGGLERLPFLFVWTFVGSILAVAVFARAVGWASPRRVAGGAYVVCALVLCAFALVLEAGVAPARAARAFFVWASVYNLFVVSIFWSVLVDAWGEAPARRLFGVISAGGTAGAVVGPALAVALARPLGPARLVLLSAGLLVASGLLLAGVKRVAGEPGGGVVAPRGGILRGLRLVVDSPLLLGIAAHALLYPLSSTILYLEQARLVALEVAGDAERTRLFAILDLAVNVGALALQVLVTGWLLGRLGRVGLAVGLSALPAITGAGLAVALLRTELVVVAALQVLRRAVHYAIDRPSREVLFTRLDADAKFRAKGILDAVVYRLGDLLGGSLGGVLGLLGLGPAVAVAAGIPLAGAWLAVARWLARRHTAD